MSIQPLVAGSGLSPQGFSIHSLPGLLPFSPSNENSWLHLCLASAVFGALAVHAVVWGSTYVQCAPAIHLPSLLVACADGDKIYLSWCLFCLVLPPDCFYPAVGLDHSLCRVCTPGNPAGGSPVRCQETLPQQQPKKNRTTTTTTTTTTRTRTRTRTTPVSLQPLVAGSGLSPQGFSIHSLPGLLPFSPSNENSWLHLCLASAVFGALAVHAIVWGSTYVQCAPAIHLPSLLVACADGDKISLSWCLFCLVLPPDCFYPAVGLDHSLCRVCTPGNPAGGSPVRCQETLTVLAVGLPAETKKPTTKPKVTVSRSPFFGLLFL